MNVPGDNWEERGDIVTGYSKGEVVDMMNLILNMGSHCLLITGRSNKYENYS